MDSPEVVISSLLLRSTKYSWKDVDFTLGRAAIGRSVLGPDFADLVRTRPAYNRTGSVDVRQGKSGVQKSRTVV
jgi:hypothetical protein